MIVQPPLIKNSNKNLKKSVKTKLWNFHPILF
jgi:hypothetical protein